MKLDFKKFFAPAKTFEEKSRMRFLAVFDAHYPIARPSRFILIAKAFAATLAVAAIVLGGVSAYADTMNVSVESPLYPLKRAAESIQLAFTPAAAKPELQATFAVRRVAEITDLEARHPTSTLLPGLAADLAADVDNSIGDSAAGAVMHGDSTAATSTSVVVATGTEAGAEEKHGGSVCKTLQSIFGSTSSIVQGALSAGRSGTLARFESECGDSNSSTPSKLPGNGQYHDRGPDGGASATVGAPPAPQGDGHGSASGSGDSGGLRVDF